MSYRTYTPAEWVAVAVREDGIYWIDADGTSVVIEVPTGEPARTYGLRGSAAGSITVRCDGDGDAWRGGDGDGNAQRYGAGNGNAWRHGAGNGDAWRGGDGTGYARRDGDGTGYARRGGAGDGNETDSHGTRLTVTADGIPYRCSFGNGWLRIGCEMHPLNHWLAHAAEIDARHDDDIADAVLALARRLAAKEKP